MKQFMIVAMAIIAVAMFATPILADTGASATVNVKMNVNPNVGVSAINANVDAGTVQTGDRSALCAFRVDANSQEVYFQVNASNLYKADDVNSLNIIPLDLGKGATVQPVNGNALNFHGNLLSFTGTPGPVVSGFPTFSTEVVQFQSSQTGVFSQEVDVTVTWLQANPEQVAGEYSGVVQLVATLFPSTGG
jgi:hypothetical protein